MRSPLRMLAAAAVLAGSAVGWSGPGPFGSGDTLPPSAPVGWVPTVEAAIAAPTSLAFSPDGAKLYVTSTAGTVTVYPVVAGHIAGAPTVFARVSSPLGVLAAADGAVFVAGAEGGDGIVRRLRDTNGDDVADVNEIVISQLPNGRHNTNGMAFGPDGLLYIANGNNTDSGFGNEGGEPEVQPYSGSVLRVSPAATNLTPSPSMVVATGFRNIYDIVFFPGTSIAAVPMNGPDGQTYNGVTRPLGEDTLSIFDVADGIVEHFGFPWCLYDRDKGGLNGFAQDPAEGSCNPLTPKAYTGLAGPAVQAHPSALFGHNVSADGLDFDPATGDLYVTEWGNLFGTTPKGHKVVRVRFDANRNVVAVDDFTSGLLPLDLTFAPDGSMWIADFAGVITRLQRVL